MTAERFSRQSFLGGGGQAAIERAVVGVVGLGGGGGHVVQQLAHVGFLNYRVFDGDGADESNLNRLVIATEDDAEAGTPKVELAQRKILSIRSSANVETFKCRWQEQPEPLRGCDIVFGCADGFAERRELEIACRRHLIPLIDIGMDVHVVGDEPPRMGGQVILSMPGSPCMTCLGFLNEASLAREAAAVWRRRPTPAGGLAERHARLDGRGRRRGPADRLDAVAPWPGVPAVRRQRRHRDAPPAARLLRRRPVLAFPTRPGRRAGVREIVRGGVKRRIGGRIQLRRLNPVGFFAGMLNRRPHPDDRYRQFQNAAI